VLFVIDGGVTVRVGGLVFILNKDDALHLAAGKEHVICANAPGWAKLLRVEFTPREIIREPLCTFPDS
jgi:quercetin dioxygenase-like cupin family protein